LPEIDGTELARLLRVMPLGRNTLTIAIADIGSNSAFEMRSLLDLPLFRKAVRPRKADSRLGIFKAERHILGRDNEDAVTDLGVAQLTPRKEGDVAITGTRDNQRTSEIPLLLFAEVRRG
jgi:hypothetical protein